MNMEASSVVRVSMDRVRPSFEAAAPLLARNTRPGWMNGFEARDRGIEAFAPRREQVSNQMIPNLLGLVLNQIDYGLILVGAGGRVTFANRAARQEFARNSVIRLQDRCLAPKNESEKDALANALKSAQTGRRTLLTLPCGDERRSMATVPLSQDSQGGDETPVLVVLGRRQLCERPTLDFFACAHRLTPAEGSVLKGVCDGLRPDAIAERTNVA